MKKILVLLMFVVTLSLFAEYQTEVIKDISYLTEPTTDKYRQEMSKLDLYLPKGAKNFPVLVYFHGGGLTGGRRGGPTYLTKEGFGVVAVEYRLHPKCKKPEYIEDCAAATAWVFKNIKKYGGNPDKIFIGGYSAGGYLTAILTMDKKYLAKHDIDADKLAGSLVQSGQVITHFTIRKEMSIPARQGLCDEYSPMFHIRKTPVPILLQCGDDDYPSRKEENMLFESMMIRYAKQPRSLVEYREYEGTHSTLGRNAYFKKDTLTFLRRHGLNLELDYEVQPANCAYIRRSQVGDVIDIGMLKGDKNISKISLDNKDEYPVTANEIVLKDSKVSKVLITKEYLIKEVAPVKEYTLKNGKEKAIKGPKCVRFWTENGMLFVELQTKGKFLKPKNGNIYSGDGMEIFVDSTPFKELYRPATSSPVLSTKQFMCSILPDDNGKNFALKLMANGFSDITKNSKTKVDVKMNGDKATMLVAIPLTEIATKDKTYTIGLNIQINDFTKGENSKVNFANSKLASYAERFHYPLIHIEALKK